MRNLGTSRDVRINQLYTGNPDVKFLIEMEANIGHRPLKSRLPCLDDEAVTGGIFMVVFVDVPDRVRAQCGRI